MSGQVSSRAESSDEASSPASDAARMRSSMDRLAESAGAKLADGVMRIPVTLDIVLGTISMSLTEVLALKGGETLPLGEHMGQSVELRVNNTPIGRADLVVSEEKTPMLAIAITELAGI